MGAEERIQAMEKDMVALLQTLIQIPSVKSEERTPGAPFGPELARVLDAALSWGEAQGFRTKNVRGYAGHIEFGEGEEIVGVLAHLDVVPAGEGWSRPPFSATVDDGKIYGRGAVDDKGPAVAAMFALKALKEAGLPLRRKIRIILGCDEESGWECMKEYFKEEPRPAVGFTPDAEFPLIFCEKGNLAVTLTGTWDGGPAGVRLKTLRGGTRRNIVPEWAGATLRIDDAGLRRAVSEKLRHAAEEDANLRFIPTEAEDLRIEAEGKAAHASLPHLGDNALARLLRELDRLGFSGGPWDVVRFLAGKIGRETDGSGLGIAASDPVSGALTLNLGVLEMDEQKCRIQLDIRYPINQDGEYLAARIREEAGSVRLEIADCSIMPPHYVDPGHPLVRTLLEAYRAETGDATGPLAIGGRTYATTLGTAVAFGPCFPGRPELAHQRDEFVYIRDLIACGRIYARALAALAGADL